MKIIIGCSRNNKIGSKLLQWWMGCNYSHVYARWYLTSQDRNIVYQSSHGMVHFQEFTNFSNENIIIQEYELNLNDSQFISFSQKCIDLCGEKYSILELIQIFLMDISDNKLDFKDQPGYICSELIAELLEDFFQVKFDKPKQFIKPIDIIGYLRTNGKIHTDTSI